MCQYRTVITAMLNRTINLETLDKALKELTLLSLGVDNDEEQHRIQIIIGNADETLQQVREILACI